MASAISYMSEYYGIPRLKKLASIIKNNAEPAVRKNYTTDSRVKSLFLIMEGKFGEQQKDGIEEGAMPEFLSNLAYFHNTNKKGKPVPESQMFKPLEQRCQEVWLPTLAICDSIDSRGRSEHAVTFFGPWIFDCNEEKALRISNEALNRCVPVGFAGVRKAWRFGKNLIPKKKRKRRQS
jgi:hypothetical protein